MLACLEKRPPVSKEDFVDLSVGRVYFRILTKGAIQWCDIGATIYKDVMNDALWMSLMEHELLVLNAGEINNLDSADANKVRNKLKELLKRYGLITEQEVNVGTGITMDEQAFLDAQKESYKQVINNWGKK